MDEIKEEYRGELVDILDSYFDPSKEQIIPVIRSGNNRRFKKGPNKENRKHKNVGEKNNNDVVATPDSTHSPKSRRRPRRRFSTKRHAHVDTATIDSPTAGATDLNQIGKSSAPEIAVA